MFRFSIAILPKNIKQRKKSRQQEEKKSLGNSMEKNNKPWQKYNKIYEFNEKKINLDIQNARI